MEINPKVKILVACHMPCQLLKDDVFTPIFVGREIASTCSKNELSARDALDWMRDSTIGDDEGENISGQNRYFNELTAFYWAWKNYDRLGDPDYIGFMHSRRHLCFDLQNSESPDRVGLIYSERIDNDYIKKFRLDAASVTSVVKQYDVVLAEKCDLEKLGTGNCYNHYLTCDPSRIHIIDYNKALEILIDKHPEYKNSVAEYNASRYAYFTNIFIMRKKLFFEYAEWLFPIVFEAHKYIDKAHYNMSEARANAYISEWLFGIWYTHLKKVRNIGSLELKRTLVKDTSIDIQQHVSPVFKTNNIALCMSASEQYIPYLAVTIQSIIDNAATSNNYDICILYENIPLSLQRKILKMERCNVSIRFVCIKGHLNKYRKEIFYIRPGVATKEAYNRFFIPEIFRKYEKILYLDCDIVVNRDVADLYNTTLDKQSLIGAVRDCEINRWANKDRNWGHSYFKNFLKIKDVYDYFQSGVLLFNVGQCNKEKIIEKLISTLERVKEPKFMDQDILNCVCEGRVHFLDLRWNVEYHIPIWSSDWMQTMPVGILNDYVASRETPWIVHFAGSKKPWDDPSLEMSDYFWKYARHTPFYEELLENIFEYRLDAARYHQIPPQDTRNADAILVSQYQRFHELAMLPIYQRKLKRIRIRSHLSWGARKQRYLQRKQELKEKIRAVERMIKDLQKLVDFHSKLNSK